MSDRLKAFIPPQLVDLLSIIKVSDLDGYTRVMQSVIPVYTLGYYLRLILCFDIGGVWWHQQCGGSNPASTSPSTRSRLLPDVDEEPRSWADVVVSHWTQRPFSGLSLEGTGSIERHGLPMYLNSGQRTAQGCSSGHSQPVLQTRS